MAIYIRRTTDAGKVQSYLATCLPIVAMPDGEGATVIEQAGAGVVCAAGAGHALAECVRQLMTMPVSELAAMGERGRRYCAREFSRAGLVSSLESWASELVLANTR